MKLPAQAGASNGASVRHALVRLTRRAEFLTVASRGRRAVTPGLVLQAWRRQGADPGPEAACIRVGFTASRKVGGAVERNRARRRLRALAAEILAAQGREGHDYVLVARRETVARSFTDLRQDLLRALRRVARDG